MPRPQSPLGNQPRGSLRPCMAWCSRARSVATPPAGSPMTFWTGELNDPHRFDAKVGFYDTTLRDGEQTVGVVLSPEDKLELARGLDELGIERIEAGFPRVSKDDWRAVELIRDAGLNAEIWGFSRAVEADVKALVELGVQASVIESPISDLKLAALGVDREAMLERIVYAISFAAEQGVRVAFFGVDGTRADPALLRDRLQDGDRSGCARGGRRRHDRDCQPRRGGRSRWAHEGVVGQGRADPLSRSQRLRPGHRGRSCGCASRRELDPGNRERHGRARRQCEPSRDRARATRAVRRRHEPPPRPGPRFLGAAARALRLRARAVQAAGRRQPVSP